MTLEQNIKLLINSQLKAILGDKFKLLLANDINTNNISKENEIIAVIKTGQGTQSGVKNILSTNTVTTITFKCVSKYLQEILSLITEYTKEVNGIFYQILKNNDDETLILPTDKGYDHNLWNATGEAFKLGLNTPSVIGSPQLDTIKTRTETSSISTSVFLITGNVYFSDLTLPLNKYFIFNPDDENPTQILIDGIQSYNDNETFNYQESTTSNDLGYPTYSGRTRVINMVLWKRNNEFCQKLETEKLGNRKFKIVAEGKELEVIFLNKVYQEINDQGTFSIILKVINDG